MSKYSVIPAGYHWIIAEGRPQRVIAWLVSGEAGVPPVPVTGHGAVEEGVGHEVYRREDDAQSLLDGPPPPTIRERVVSVLSTATAPMLTRIVRASLPEVSPQTIANTLSKMHTEGVIARDTAGWTLIR
jgi:hypothetical protein